MLSLRSWPGATSQTTGVSLPPNTSVQPLVLRFVFRLVGRATPERFDDPAFLDLVERAGGGVASHATTTLIAVGESVRAIAGASAMLGLIASLDARLAALAAVSAIPVLVVARLDGIDSARTWSGDTVESRLRGYLGQVLRDPAAGGELRALGLTGHLLDRLAALFAGRVAALANSRAVLVIVGSSSPLSRPALRSLPSPWSSAMQ